MRWLVVSLFLAVPALGGEYAVLKSGARLRAERHELAGSKIRLFTASGTTELDASQVSGFEAEEYVPPALPRPAAAKAPARNPGELLDAAARKYGLPAAFVRSVAKHESGFQAHAVSPKGAIGLMQLMPETARQYGVDPLSPEQNADAGARYLRDLLLKYHCGVYHALAAYNAGPGAVDKYNGIPPYRETKAYIRRVVSDYQKKQ